MIKGLVVGKFMPFHRGHQLLIESALAQVDELTIVVYDSTPEGDYTPMPIQKRIKWIADLYPQVYNIVPRVDPLDKAMKAGLLIHDKDNPQYAPAYAKDLEFLGEFDYVFSSEDYGNPFAEALDAKSVIVDL